MREVNRYRLRKIFIAIYIVYLAVYCALNGLLKLCDMEFRTWFEVVSLLYLWLYPVVGIGYLVFAWRERKLEEYRVQQAGKMQENYITQERAFRCGTGLFLSVYGIVMTLVSFFLLMLMIFTVDSEKQMENGILRVGNEDALFGGMYEYYEPVGFFFRKELDREEYPGSQYGESGINNSVIQDTESAEDSEQEEIDIERIKHPDKNQAFTEEFMEEFQEKMDNVRYLNVYEGDRPLADAVWLIYEKHYIDNPNSESEAPSFYYNAKGNFYAKVMQKEYSSVLLVYNGMSENGKCQLFVAEEEHYDADGNQLDNTSLLEFYAVNLEEGLVYEAHKTTWGGAESEEYRKAARE